VSTLAGILGVTRRTVERWISGGIQGCNVNVDKLLDAAWTLCPGEALRILSARAHLLDVTGEASA
jgi:hypothetical protein